MSKVTVNSWGERFALINRYNPTPEQVVTAFGLDSVAEYETARECLDAGTFVIPQDFDPETYGNVFMSVPTTATTGSRPRDEDLPPETSTSLSVTRTPKKRGRKGTKIAQAFGAITTDPVPAEAFAESHGVSMNVLRQAKRFDRTGGTKVRVKKIDGTLMVFRDAE